MKRAMIEFAPKQRRGLRCGREHTVVGRYMPKAGGAYIDFSTSTVVYHKPRTNTAK